MTTIKKIDKDSGEAVDNRLALFSIPPTQIGIVRSSYKELLPLNALNQSPGPFLFRLFSEGRFLDASKTMISLVLSLEKKDTDGEWVPITDGTATGKEGDAHVSVIQYLGLTWIQRITMSINGVDVFDSGVNFAHRAMILHELSSNRQVNEGFYATGLYYDDVIEDKDDPTGTGFLERAKRFAKGKKCRMIAKLDFDLARQDQLLIPHLDILWQIYRNKDTFTLQRPKYAKGTTTVENKTEYRIRLHDVRLLVKQVDLTQSLNNSIAAYLEKAPAKYYLKKYELRTLFLGKGLQEFTHPFYSTICPRRLIVTFIDSLAFNGAVERSPFTFEHANVRSISAEFGGFMFPSVPMNLNFEEGEYERAYNDLWVGMNLDNWPANDQRTLAIDMKKFAKSSCFFIIPMTSTLEDTGGLELIRTGVTTVRAQFNKPIKDSGIEVCVLAEFDQVLSISHSAILSDTNI